MGMVLAQCNNPQCFNTLSLNTGYAVTQIMAPDSSSSPNWVALPNQDFILNADPTCCPIVNCWFSYDAT